MKYWIAFIMVAFAGAILMAAMLEMFHVPKTEPLSFCVWLVDFWVHSAQALLLFRACGLIKFTP